VRIVVACVGRLRGPPFADDLAHYEKLLGRYARLELHEVREAGFGAERRAEALEDEAGRLLKRIPKEAFVCALDREGAELSSEQLAGLLDERRSIGTDLCFVIGGAFGLAPAVLERADRRLSLGKVTLPHELARVVLLEQLFRAHKIVLREPYHY
jgi:23S rRNA (pseudouridine1915-N3)-methyltransferase